MADRARADRRIGPAAVDLLRAIALRAEVARRLEAGSGLAVLRSIVEATVALFEAEAASIALYDPATNRLVFEVAAGEQGQGVIGVSIAPDQGIAGYVFSTGQPLALSDVERDPRFGRAVAEQTAYLPRSIVAVPLVDARGTIGVLEVLDKRTQAAFSLRDIELAGVFARQAAIAISASRVELDVEALLRSAIADLVGWADGMPAAPTDEAVSTAGATTAAEAGHAVDEIVAIAVGRLAGDDDSRLWALVDQVARLRRVDPDSLDLVADLLAALSRHAERATRPGRRSRPATGR